ncbi:MAG TPA: hypothetical protein VFH51_06915 [Myxococcota bacterium]|nr:hypothetical protein [Myxococcota bacterium]
MLDDCPHLTLEELNRTTQAWVEMEYQRRIHSEIGTAPLTRYTKIRDVGRPCPGSEKLRQSFTIRLTRRARSSDGTISLEGTRFELPNRLRNLQQVTLWSYLRQSDVIILYTARASEKSRESVGCTAERCGRLWAGRCRRHGAVRSVRRRC